MPGIGFGGGCHWCTEAVFQQLRGVSGVRQGWIAPADDLTSFSEAVTLEYDTRVTSLQALVAIHLHTHASTSQHSLRHRYRSAVYAYSPTQQQAVEAIIQKLQVEFESPLITQAMMFGAFEQSPPRYRSYYRQNPDRPFCQTYITPKLARLPYLLGRYR